MTQHVTSYHGKLLYLQIKVYIFYIQKRIENLDNQSGNNVE